VLLSVILVRYLAHTGLALAISIAAWVNAGLLLLVLLKRGVFMPQQGWLWFLLRVLIAVTLMGACLLYFNNPAEVWYGQSGWQRIAKLCQVVGIGALSYFIALSALGIRPKQLLLPNSH
jgi:putative peptidoglycan lipid II flippase